MISRALDVSARRMSDGRWQVLDAGAPSGCLRPSGTLFVVERKPGGTALPFDAALYAAVEWWREGCPILPV